MGSRLAARCTALPAEAADIPVRARPRDGRVRGDGRQPALERRPLPPHPECIRRRSYGQTTRGCVGNYGFLLPLSVVELRTMSIILGAVGLNTPGQLTTRTPAGELVFDDSLLPVPILAEHADLALANIVPDAR